MKVLCQLTEGHDELLLIVLILHRVHGLREQSDFLELHDHFIELLNKILIARNNDTGGVLTLGEECQRVICPFLEVAIADDNAKRFCLLLNTVGARVGLHRSWYFKSLSTYSTESCLLSNPVRNIFTTIRISSDFVFFPFTRSEMSL